MSCSINRHNYSSLLPKKRVDYLKENNYQYVTMPFISVIVPIYNIKEYLEKCLISLQTQTMHDIEIILIDDGSTDGSGVICDVFAESDSRFRVIHKSNAGLAAARNDGVKLAKADYIMFVDGDDWVEKDFCELPYSIAMEYRIDLVVFQYLIHCNNKERRRRLFPRKGIITKEKLLTRYWSYASSVVWNKLYKKSLFDEVAFPVGHLAEDGAVTHNVVHRAEEIYLLNEYLYHYNKDFRSDSITGTRSKQYIEDSFAYGNERINDLEKWGYDCSDEEKRLALLYLIVYGRYEEKSSYYSSILQNSYYFPRNASLKHKVLFWIYRISPKHFDLISVFFGLRVR